MSTQILRNAYAANYLHIMTIKNIYNIFACSILSSDLPLPYECYCRILKCILLTSLCKLAVHGNIYWTKPNQTKTDREQAFVTLQLYSLPTVKWFKESVYSYRPLTHTHTQKVTQGSGMKKNKTQSLVMHFFLLILCAMFLKCCVICDLLNCLLELKDTCELFALALCFL